MDEKNINRKKAKINVLKLIGLLSAICAVLVMLFLFTPQRIGHIKRLRALLMLEYFGFIQDKRSNPELIEALNSRDEAGQLDAILAMSYRSSCPENVEALMSYIKSENVSTELKNFAIWALGELHAQDAKEFLYSLKGNENFNQHEVSKAIKKIEGKIPRPFFRK